MEMMREQETLKAITVDDLIRLLHRLQVFNSDEYLWEWVPDAFGGEGAGIPIKIERVSVRGTDHRTMSAVGDFMNLLTKFEVIRLRSFEWTTSGYGIDVKVELY